MDNRQSSFLRPLVLMIFVYCIIQCTTAGDSVYVNMTKVNYGTIWQETIRIWRTSLASAYVYLDILEGKCYYPKITINTIVTGFEEGGDYLNIYIDNIFLTKWYVAI